MTILYSTDPLEDAVCSVCRLAVDVDGPGGCTCDWTPADDLECEICPDCGVTVASGEPYAPFCSVDHREAFEDG